MRRIAHGPRGDKVLVLGEYMPRPGQSREWALRMTETALIAHACTGLYVTQSSWDASVITDVGMTRYGTAVRRNAASMAPLHVELPYMACLIKIIDTIHIVVVVAVL